MDDDIFCPFCGGNQNGAEGSEEDAVNDESDVQKAAENERDIQGSIGNSSVNVGGSMNDRTQSDQPSPQSEMMSGQMNSQAQYGQPMPQQYGMMNNQMPYGQVQNGMMGGQMNGQTNGQSPYGQPAPQQYGMMNNQMPYGQTQNGMMNGQVQYGQPKNGQVPKPKKSKKKGSKKKKVIIISSIAAVLLIACAVVYFLGFRKPTKKYLLDYFTGPDPNYENVAGVPDYYHFWYYLGGVSGDNGVYCKITDVEIIESKFSFFSGSARVALTTEDEYLMRKIYADLKLSGVAGNWKIDSVDVKLDDPDNKIISISDKFVERVVNNKLEYSKYQLGEYDKSRVRDYRIESGKDAEFVIEYDVTNLLEFGVYDGYVTISGEIEVDPEHRDSEYYVDTVVDEKYVMYREPTIDDSGNGGSNTGSNDSGNGGSNTGSNDNGNSGNNTGSNDNGNSGNNSGNNDNSGNNNGSASTGNNPLAGLPDINNEKIYLYSWNEEFGTLLDYFLQKYPEYSNLIEYVNVGLPGTDEAYLDAIKSNLNDSQKPVSMVMYEGECADQLADSRFASLYDLGASAYYKDAYKFTKREATFGGVLKGMSPYVCPSGFIYRKDIAEEVLGTSDPKTIATLINTWEGFEDVAAKMKESGYYMLCSTGDLYRGFGVTTYDGKATSECINMADRFMSNGYLNYNDDKMWSEEWDAAMDRNVFGYFGPNWLINYSMLYFSSKEWGFCPGPEYHHWGGSYIGISDSCPNKGLAALIIVTLCCDENIQYSYAVDHWYCPNNKVASQMIIESGVVTYNSDILKTPIEEVNSEIADGIN